MIVFENSGEIDVRSISSFGVSVKEGDGPIGFFGTGLKYAIAVLLRLRHKVTVYSGLSVIEFGTRREIVRGQEFDFVTMSIDGWPADALGFTTQLGKQWEPWMAYRELACNCKDEGGSIDSVARKPAPREGVTFIIVDGQAVSEAYANRAAFILEDEPAIIVGRTEVRRQSGSAFFYRGVRVHAFERPGVFTYNDNDSLELTEDRTCKSHWEPTYRVIRAILRADDKEFIRACVNAADNTLEGGLDYHGWSIKPSPAFLSVVGECVADRMCKVNATAVKVWKEQTGNIVAPREVTLTKVQQVSMERALDFCEKLGFRIRGSFPIKVAESLGEGILGLAHEQTIYIAERVFQIGGTKQLAATLIEEYIHLRHGWKDLTRELQNFLFEKIVCLGEELSGEPL